MGFKQWLNEAKKVELQDPTGIGLKITAAIEIVPGESGRGEYVGRIEISTPNHIGGGSYYTPFQHSAEAAQTELRKKLQQPIKVYVTKSLVRDTKSNELIPIEISGLPAMQVQTLEPVLCYGGSWQPGALEQMKGYNPETHKKGEDFFNKIKSVTQQVQNKWQQEQKHTPKFGDGPPKSGQYITKKDIELLPDMLSAFGDFKVVVKWSRRPRHFMMASALAKNYETMTADAAVKTDDYVREIWVA